MIVHLSVPPDTVRNPRCLAFHIFEAWWQTPGDLPCHAAKSFHLLFSCAGDLIFHEAIVTSPQQVKTSGAFHLISSSYN